MNYNQQQEVNYDRVQEKKVQDCLLDMDKLDKDYRYMAVNDLHILITKGGAQVCKHL